MRLESVIYRETEHGPMKRGVLVDEGMGPLLDMKGKAVEDVWHYHRENRWVLEIPEDTDA
jgi:hypothetical protein